MLTSVADENAQPRKRSRRKGPRLWHPGKIQPGPCERHAQCHSGVLLRLTVKKSRRGSFVYTDKFKSYDSLMFCGYRHLKVDHGKYFSSGKMYINGMEGFWSWAKERFIKHHGVSREYFPLYLKELEFRYNNRDSDIFDLVADYMCDLVPKRD